MSCIMTGQRAHNTNKSSHSPFHIEHLKAKCISLHVWSEQMAYSPLWAVAVSSEQCRNTVKSNAHLNFPIKNSISRTIADHTTSSMMMIVSEFIIHIFIILFIWNVIEIKHPIKCISCLKYAALKILIIEIRDNTRFRVFRVYEMRCTMPGPLKCLLLIWCVYL